MTAEFVGYPDVKVILRKKQFQWVLPSSQQFDINISDFVTSLNSVAARTNDNLYLDPTLGVAMVAPLYANRNNFIENVSLSQDRYKVEVPLGAPQETENEINRRVWISAPTVNQNPTGNNAEFKKADQEFAEPGEVVDKSGNPVDNTYPGPMWTEESQESNNSGDPTVKRASPVSWCFQKQANANTEFFLVQKSGLFTNQSFWIDIKKYKSDTPSNIPKEELENTTAGNRFDRYQTGSNLYSYFAIRVGSDTPEDIQRPKGFDIVFPIGGSPFIYDHQGQGLEDDDEDEPVVINSYNYTGFIANKKDDPEWVLPNDVGDFNLQVMFVRGKMVIQSSWASTPWFFPSDLSSKPFPRTQERYENFFMPASKVCLMGRGLKFMFNFNPLEFNIYQNGKEKDPHGKITFGPFPTRDSFPVELEENLGWVDFDEFTLDNEFQNFTVVPFDKYDFGLNGEQLSRTFGFDVVKDEYASIIGNYTSMMIPVNPNDISSIRDLIKTTMRPPSIEEQRLVKPIGGPEKISVSGNSGPIFKNMMLEVNINCKAPSFGPYTDGGSDEIDVGKIHRRFASPILWRLKGRMKTPPILEPEEFDISPFVRSISYDSVAQDFTGVEQNFTISVRVPKDYEFKDPIGTVHSAFETYTRTQIRSRNELLSLIYDGTREVEVWLGYWGTKRFQDGALENPVVNGITLFEKESGIKRGSTRVKVFTGLAIGGSISETYGNDIVSLKCVEKTQMLKDFPIMNSPYYDGMLVERAFYHICTLSGLPQDMFLVRSKFANKEVLPMAYTFMEPSIKFQFNTPLLDAVKEIAGYFKHTIRVDPDGRIVLTDLYYNGASGGEDYLAVIEDIPISHQDFIFHVDGWADRENGNDPSSPPWPISGNDDPNGGGGRQSPFKRCYEQFNYDKNTIEHNTQLQIQSVNRLTGAFTFDGEIADVDAVENPESKSYIGFHKPLRLAQPAFGEKKYVDKFKSQMSTHILQSPLKVSFTTYGRPTLRVLDVIEVVHQDPKSYLISTGNGSVAETTANKIKYRVTKISGSLTYEDNKWQYKMDVDAIHK